MGIRGMQGTASHLEYIAPKGKSIEEIVYIMRRIYVYVKLHNHI